MLLNNFSVQAGQHVTRIALCGVVVNTGTRPIAVEKNAILACILASMHLTITVLHSDVWINIRDL